MLVLGLLLIIGAALITVGAIYDAGETATVEILGQTITTTAAGVFLAGAITMLMFLVGVWAISASMGRARRKRAERKAVKRDQRDSVQRLEEERAALREENERLSRELAAGAGAGAGAAGASTVSSRQPVTHEPLADSTTARTDRETAATHPDSPGHAGHAGHTDHAGRASSDPLNGSGDDRVIDHRSDLTSHDTTTGGRHRDLP